MMPKCVLALLLAALPLTAQDAAAVLNRYVQVTGGADVYRRYNALHLFYTITPAGKTAVNVDYFHTRDGRTRIETDTGDATSELGVSNGVAWTFAANKAGILTGKRAARLLAQSAGFDEDDWHIRYPTATLLANQTIKGVPCRHLKLTRTDGSVVERFYDLKTGLLLRELSNDMDEHGNEHPVAADMDSYDSFVGIRRPTLIHIKGDSGAIELQINTVTYSKSAEPGAFELPQDVVRALVAHNAKNASLPNPMDLIDQYVAASGGKAAYQAIKTEAIQAEAILKTENLKFPVTIYTAGRKHYSSYDIPSMGKFEAGDDGEMGWERSVVLGPKLRPHSAASEFMGPEPGEVVEWSDASLNMETISEDNVNGEACYQVRLGPPDPQASTACFSVKSKLLLKTFSPSADGATEQYYSDYRSVAGILICHHIETAVAGHSATVEIKQISINHPLPEGVFNLPPDVQALKAKRH